MAHPNLEVAGLGGHNEGGLVLNDEDMLDDQVVEDLLLTTGLSL